jgi:hypothetical protein
MLTAEIERHVRAAVAGATHQTDPTAHLIVDQILPHDLYDQLLAHLPPAETFPARDAYRADLWPSRHPMPPGSAEIWTAFELEIVPTIAAVLVDRLAAEIASFQQRFGGPIGPLAPREGRIMLRRPGYLIRPHLDPHSAATMTALFYLTRPETPRSSARRSIGYSRPIPRWRSGRPIRTRTAVP